MQQRSSFLDAKDSWCINPIHFAACSLFSL